MFYQPLADFSVSFPLYHKGRGSLRLYYGTFGLFSEDINQNWEKDSFNDDEQYKDDFKIEFKE